MTSLQGVSRPVSANSVNAERSTKSEENESTCLPNVLPFSQKEQRLARAQETLRAVRSYHIDSWTHEAYKRGEVMRHADGKLGWNAPSEWALRDSTQGRCAHLYRRHYHRSVFHSEPQSLEQSAKDTVRRREGQCGEIAEVTIVEGRQRGLALDYVSMSGIDHAVAGCLESDKFIIVDAWDDKIFQTRESALHHYQSYVDKFVTGTTVDFAQFGPSASEDQSDARAA